MSEFIPLSVPNLKGNEQRYVQEAIESEWISTAGTFVNQFETEIAEYLKVEGAVACQSGTAGIHLALLSQGIGRDDEVIVPTLTFIAAVNPVRYVGAEPVFMDCDDSLCMDPEKLERFCRMECHLEQDKLINNKTSKPVKAILVVHVFGNMADMEYICHIAGQYKLKVIEDATEALGTYYETGKFSGKFAGTIGDVGIYSFNGNKIITTGGGGMVVAKNMKTLKYIKYLSTQAKNDEFSFFHDEVGYNYRMTNVQAAMGVAQLEQIETFIEAKQQNYEAYRKEGVRLLPFRHNVRPNYWFYCHLIDGAQMQQTLIDDFHKNMIQTRPIWGLIHKQKPYIDCQSYEIEKAIYYQERVLNLPCSSNLSLKDVEKVVSAIKSVGN